MPSLIAPPLSSDSSDFADRGDSFHSALAVFNASADVESSKIQQAQLGSALYGAFLPLYRATSTTSNTIGYGTLTFTIQTNKLYSVGMRVRAYSGVNWISGSVTAYTPGTGALSIKVLNYSGSGTFASWTMQPELRRQIGTLTTVASAGTVDLSYASDSYVELTGTTTVTAFTMTEGQTTYLLAKAATPLTYHSTDLRLPGYLSYVTEIGDILQVTRVNSITSVVIHKLAGMPVVSRTTKAIFGYGYTTVYINASNTCTEFGSMSTDITGVGTARTYLAAAGYGGDKALFGYGTTGTNVSMTNLVSNLGAIATDVTGVGTARYELAATGYGGDKAIFGYGATAISTFVTLSNLVGNTGVVVADNAGVGATRKGLAAAGYGSGQAIFGFGYNYISAYISTTNLISDAGVVASDASSVGTARHGLAAANYGLDKAIFGYGYNGGSSASMTNLVSNLGVIATDTTGVGTGRHLLSAASYGVDKAIFGYGATNPAGTLQSMTNLVNNLGVVASDTTGVGTARYGLAAAGFSS